MQANLKIELHQHGVTYEAAIPFQDSNLFL